MAAHVMISLVISLFFARGFATGLLYSFIPGLKSLYALSYTEAMLAQLYFFLGYFVFSLPAALILARIGYVRAIVFGLIVMIAGCLIFSPATWLGLYPGFLIALFVVAAGITLLQVASSPLITVIGASQSAHSRFTLAQAFNSFGTTVGPLVGGWLIFGSTKLPGSTIADALHIVQIKAIQLPFFVIGVVLAVVALIFWLNRDFPVPGTEAPDADFVSGLRLLKKKHFLFGVIAIFAYVGAEVAVGSTMINYLMQATVLSVSALRASQLLSLYWGGAMFGRFLGAAILRIVSPAIALSVCGSGAALLAILSANTMGSIAATAIVAIGLFNSIMFPTIFALAIEGLGDRTPQGSGMLCMAIIGGAIVPLIMGAVADTRGLTFSLIVPTTCYLWVAAYGTYMKRHSVVPAQQCH